MEQLQRTNQAVNERAKEITNACISGNDELN